MRPFVIDVYTCRCPDCHKKVRIETDSLEAALSLMGTKSQSPDVSRIVISRRLGGTDEVSKMKVWTRGMAA